MIDSVPTWGDALSVSEWTPTAKTETVMRIFETYDKLPAPAT